MMAITKHDFYANICLHVLVSGPREIWFWHPTQISALFIFLFVRLASANDVFLIFHRIFYVCSLPSSLQWKWSLKSVQCWGREREYTKTDAREQCTQKRPPLYCRNVILAWRLWIRMRLFWCSCTYSIAAAMHNVEEKGSCHQMLFTLSERCTKWQADLGPN